MTIGSAKTALMAATGIQTRGAGGENRVRSIPDFPVCGLSCHLRHRIPATPAQASTGTKIRKAAWPWIRNQPASAASQQSWVRPAATEAIATTKAK